MIRAGWAMTFQVRGRWSGLLGCYREIVGFNQDESGFTRRMEENAIYRC